MPRASSLQNASALQPLAAAARLARIDFWTHERSLQHPWSLRTSKEQTHTSTSRSHGPGALARRISRRRTPAAARRPPAARRQHLLPALCVHDDRQHLRDALLALLAQLDGMRYLLLVAAAAAIPLPEKEADAFVSATFEGVAVAVPRFADLGASQSYAAFLASLGIGGAAGV